MQYDDVIVRMRESYGADAAERRDAQDIEHWKIEERAAFLNRLQDDGCTRLLEVGAGPGADSSFFQASGVDVVASDLSAQMVATCREKGLEAHVAGFLELGAAFPAGSFDAVYALNCLLHVPNADLPAVLDAIRGLLRPGGLFFLGVYGGDGTEGIDDQDSYTPARFFSFPHARPGEIPIPVTHLAPLITHANSEHGHGRSRPDRVRQRGSHAHAATSQR
jgi:SAM-dependent methyltransferase